jgi:hypothetical protein
MTARDRVRRGTRLEMRRVARVRTRARTIVVIELSGVGASGALGERWPREDFKCDRQVFRLSRGLRFILENGWTISLYVELVGSTEYLMTREQQ